MTRVGGISWKRLPHLMFPSPSRKITEFLLLNGIKPEHRKLLVDPKNGRYPQGKKLLMSVFKGNDSSLTNLETGLEGGDILPNR